MEFSLNILCNPIHAMGNELPAFTATDNFFKNVIFTLKKNFTTIRANTACIDDRRRARPRHAFHMACLLLLMYELQIKDYGL